MDKKIDQNWIESFRLAHKNFQEAYLFSYNQFIYLYIYFYVINVNFIDSLILLIYMIFTNIFLISFMKF